MEVAAYAAPPVDKVGDPGSEGSVSLVQAPRYHFLSHALPGFVEHALEVEGCVEFAEGIRKELVCEKSQGCLLLRAPVLLAALVLWFGFGLPLWPPRLWCAGSSSPLFCAAP